MSTGHSIERRGIELLRKWLIERGRTVAESDTRTFDLVVDGNDVEVKCKGKPYVKFDVIGLTKNQFKALEAGDLHSVFVVCNVDNPLSLEVREIPARDLLAAEPEIDSTYYWYKRQLDAMVDKTPSI